MSTATTACRQSLQKGSPATSPACSGGSSCSRPTGSVGAGASGLPRPPASLAGVGRMLSATTCLSTSGQVKVACSSTRQASCRCQTADPGGWGPHGGGASGAAAEGGAAGGAAAAATAGGAAAATSAGSSWP
jgi:hypothetical protein